jgi:hypothetical protein
MKSSGEEPGAGGVGADELEVVEIVPYLDMAGEVLGLGSAARREGDSLTWSGVLEGRGRYPNQLLCRSRCTCGSLTRWEHPEMGRVACSFVGWPIKCFIWSGLGILMLW